MTKAQIQAEKNRIGNIRLARAVLAFFLLVSLAGNVSVSIRNGAVGIAIGVFIPFGLFVTNLMFERLGDGLRGFKKFVAYVGIGAGVLITGIFSYYHLHTLVYEATGNVLFSWMLPAAVDVPMLLASLVLSEARKVPVPTPRKASAPRPVAVATAGARATVAAPSRKRSTSATKIIPATA